VARWMRARTDPRPREARIRTPLPPQRRFRAAIYVPSCGAAPVDLQLGTRQQRIYSVVDAVDVEPSSDRAKICLRNKDPDRPNTPGRADSQSTIAEPFRAIGLFDYEVFATRSLPVISNSTLG
jgi:hypothetical protein